MKALIAVAALSLTGCALVPNTVSPFVEHVSHASQHFGADKTHYGYEQIGVAARWNVKHAFLEISEGFNPGKRNSAGAACDALYGGREVFTARVGYTFEVRP